MKTLIAMSGGVDSSVAAYLIKSQGYDCIGCTMKLYDNEDIGISHNRTCCSLDDVEDARSVAYKIGMPYYVFNLKDGFGYQKNRRKMKCVAKLKFVIVKKEQAATVIPIDNNSVKVIFDVPQRAVTPGQAAVLYSGEIVLGGGTISNFGT